MDVNTDFDSDVSSDSEEQADSKDVPPYDEDASAFDLSDNVAALDASLSEGSKGIFPDDVDSDTCDTCSEHEDSIEDVSDQFSGMIDEPMDDEPDWERTSLTPSEEEQILKMIADEELELPEEMTDEPVHAEIHLPDKSGTFDGERGNSDFVPSDQSALDMLQLFGRGSVAYRDGYPDFSPFSTHDSPWGSIDCQVEIGHMTDQRENPSFEYGSRPRGSSHDHSYDLGNFAQADNELLDRIKKSYPDATVEDIVNYRKDNRLTWHECSDGKTMQLVPTEIHDACRHSGGVSEMKYRMAWGNVSLDEDE